MTFYRLLEKQIWILVWKKYWSYYLEFSVETAISLSIDYFSILTEILEIVF